MSEIDMKQDSEEHMDDVGRLIRYAGEREQVSAERMETARTSVGEHWQGIVTSQRSARRRVRLNQFAIAASVVVAIGAAFVLMRPASVSDIQQVATVDRVLGDVLVNGEPTTAGATISIEAIIETRIGGRVAIELASGQSLRVDSDTRIVAHNPDRYALASGRVYFDSNLVSGGEAIFIETPFGTATDVGTQYMVHVTSGFLTVGVREGEVRLDREDEPEVAIPDGSLFELEQNGDSRRSDLASTDTLWNWTASVAPDFDIEGVSLRVYLEWYAREQGLQIAWADARAQAYSETTELSGSINGLSLEEGLEVVRKIAPFRYEIAGTTLAISTE